MTKINVSFVIDRHHLGGVLEMLPVDVEDLHFKVVRQSAVSAVKVRQVKVRQDYKHGWEVVASYAEKKPKPVGHFRDRLREAGFKTGTVYNSIKRAAKVGAIKQVKVNGVKHFIKP